MSAMLNRRSAFFSIVASADLLVRVWIEGDGKDIQPRGTSALSIGALDRGENFPWYAPGSCTPDNRTAVFLLSQNKAEVFLDQKVVSIPQLPFLFTMRSNVIACS
jgi:hypothetical protein